LIRNSFDHVVVDEEFSAMIPPLRSDERLLLEENLLRDGCRDALVVWPQEPTEEQSACECELAGKWKFITYELEDGSGEPATAWECQECGERTFEWDSILLDGHNRLEICRRLNIGYETVGISLPDREAAADWIDANQLARRNLNPDQASIIRGRRYNRFKKAQNDGGKGTRKTTVPQNAGRFTADVLAKQHGVSRATIERDGQFAAAVEKVEAIDPEITKKVTKGEAPARIYVIKAAKLMDEHPEKAAAVLQGKASIKSIRSEIRNEERRSLVTKIPVGKFAVILADPPWQYSNSGFNEAAESQYPTMSTDDICAMAGMVRDFSTPETVLFLWATNPLLEDAIRVLKAWGFTYKTNMCWIKDRGRGKGWFLKSRHEILLIGTRENTPHPQVRPDSCFEADRGPVHSRKPGIVYDIIESMFGGSKLEMFCRIPREGWEAHGNEC